MLAILVAALLGAAPTRTITAQLTTVFVPDDGSVTTIPAPLPDGETVTAYQLNKATGAYDVFPGTVDTAGNVTIANVPEGNYFLAIPDDVFGAQIVELNTSTPDLSSLVSARPDLAIDNPFQPLVVNFNLTNNDPFTPGGVASTELFQYQSSQAAIDQSPFQFAPTRRPATSATTFNGPMSWSGHFDQAGLPDAAKGDVVWFHAGPNTPLTSGPTTLHVRSTDKFARLELTLLDGTSPTVDVALEPTVSSAAAGGEVLYTQYAALTPRMGPGAAFNQFFLDILGVPHATRFPDSPNGSIRTLLDFSPPAVRILSAASSPFSPAAAPPDTDYGALSYGEFLDSQWKKQRQTEASYSVVVPLPDGTSVASLSLLISAEPERGPEGDDSAAKFDPARASQPKLGPVLSPRIAGSDAFSPQTGVGLTPTLSWDAPALGKATSYRVIVNAADFSSTFTAFVRKGTSFVIPPGFLTAGQTYFAVITSVSAPHDHVNAPAFRSGVPAYFTDCTTAGFTP